MIRVSARDLRANLRRYMDLLEEGEEIEVLRNSRLVGTFKPAKPKVKISPIVDTAATLDTPLGMVSFRQFWESDRQKVLDLYGEPLDVRVYHDVYGVSMAYLHDAGEFLVAVLGSENEADRGRGFGRNGGGDVVACGGFSWSSVPEQAHMKRLKVREDCAETGVGERLRSLLEIAAQAKGYKKLIDVSNTT